jgi:hypothetical protein
MPSRTVACASVLRTSAACAGGGLPPCESKAATFSGRCCGRTEYLLVPSRLEVLCVPLSRCRLGTLKLQARPGTTGDPLPAGWAHPSWMGSPQLDGLTPLGWARMGLTPVGRARPVRRGRFRGSLGYSPGSPALRVRRAEGLARLLTCLRGQARFVVVCRRPARARESAAGRHEAECGGSVEIGRDDGMGRREGRRASESARKGEDRLAQVGERRLLLAV